MDLKVQDMGSGDMARMALPWRERLAAIDPNNYTHVVLRVSAGENPSSHLYKELGFEEMGVYMEVSSMRTDGSARLSR